MKKQITNLLALLILFIIPLKLKAQVKEIKVTGEVTTPLSVNDAAFQKYKQVIVKYKDKDGKSHDYSGVVLSDILQTAGVSLGENLKGRNLAKYLLVEAADGYQVTFALAELDKAFTDRLIILANQVDGKPLSPTEGPYRIIVQDEKKQGRCIRQVTGMRIAFAK